jgi:hypothetical protein
VDWLPLGGPHFGASGKINLAFYDALQSMSQMSASIGIDDTFATRAENLRKSIISHLWNEEAGILRMTDTVSPSGICQDINAYSTILDISPSHSNTTKILASADQPPFAFQNLERWDKNKIISPYSCGFAAEALFVRSEGVKAVQLIEKVWGDMSNPANSNYSGGHWEAMDENGSPVHDDTSLIHGWSTWPVFLLPKYLVGLEPLKPGWVKWKVQPVLAGLESVDVHLSTPAGLIAVSLYIQEAQRTGEIILDVPKETTCEISPPLGWQISESAGEYDVISRENKVLIRQGGKLAIKIHKGTPSTSSNSLRKPASSSNEKGNAEVVEDVEDSERVIDQKGNGFRGFLNSLFGKCF